MSLKSYINSVLSTDDRNVDPIFLKQTLNAIVDSIPPSKPEPIDLGVNVTIPALQSPEEGATVTNVDIYVDQEVADRLYPGAVVRFDLYDRDTVEEGEGGTDEYVLIQEDATAVITQGLEAYGANITVNDNHFCIDIWPAEVEMDPTADNPEEEVVEGPEILEDQPTVASIVGYMIDHPDSYADMGSNYYEIYFDPDILGAWEVEDSWEPENWITIEYYDGDHIIFKKGNTRISLHEAADNYWIPYEVGDEPEEVIEEVLEEAEDDPLAEIEEVPEEVIEELPEEE